MSFETIRPKKVRRIDAIVGLEHLFRQVFAHVANIAGFVSEFKTTREPRIGREKNARGQKISGDCLPSSWSFVAREIIVSGPISFAVDGA